MTNARATEELAEIFLTLNSGLLERGDLILAGPRLDAAFGLGVFYAESFDAAQQLIAGDPVVPYVAGEHSAAILRHMGFAPAWHRYPMAHQVCTEELNDLGDWLEARFATASTAG
mgnify:CR=1 FL=1